MFARGHSVDKHSHSPDGAVLPTRCTQKCQNKQGTVSGLLGIVIPEAVGWPHFPIC